MIRCCLGWSLLLAGAALGVAPPGTLETVAGTGQAGYTGDGGPATQARLNQPFLCAIDGRGNLLVADAFNHCIRQIDRKTGHIATVVGHGVKGYSGDHAEATKATLNEPYAVVADGNEDLYIVDRLNAVIRKVDGKTGIITTVAGNGQKGYAGDGGPATLAQLREPNDCHLDGHGGLLIADVADWRLRRLDLKTGIITTVAGTGKPSGKLERTQLGDGGPASRAILVGARAVCVDGMGNTYICEREGNAVRRVDAQGIITTFAGTSAKGYTGDGGPAQQATFNGPKGIRCDRHGNIFVADTENHAIRRIDAKTQIVTTVAGGHRGGDGDNGPATRAGLDRPHGCIVDADGNLYIADSSNHRVRRVLAP
jgi:streptogramin lyase